MTLSYDQFVNQIAEKPVVSLSQKLSLDADITPVSVLDVYKNHAEFVLLEGVSEQVRHDRFSYLGLDPYLKITCREQAFELSYSSGETKTHSGDLYEFLDGILQKYALSQDGAEKYMCGLMGSLSYECVTFLEEVPLPEKRALDTPYAFFIVPRSVLIFDNETSEVMIVRNVFSESVSDLKSAYEAASQELEAMVETISSISEASLPQLEDTVGNYDDLTYRCNLDMTTFMSHVQTCKDYITAGDIFQIQVSRRADVDFDGDPLMLYRYVRQYNPSPFLFYLKFDGMHLIGASPEILVGVEDRKMTIRPLAGTRKRYSSDKTEEEIIQELISDEKEKAEHIMLVDLARHDIGRACKVGSVKVNDLMSTEKYTHVIHMVSDVEGELEDDKTAMDAFKYGFPAGTVTGTPKIRAMEIISELENVQREFYSGGIVYFDFKGDLKSALTIRSMLVKDGKVFTQAAAGIVADSIPEMEYKETQNKMRSCLSAMHQFGSHT